MNKLEKVEDIDYKAFFHLGFIFNCTGIAIMIATKNLAFIGMMGFGIILMKNSLRNKDKWNDKNV